MNPATAPTFGIPGDPDGDAPALNRRWLVAGTAGGVGTTTVTAALFAAARDRLAGVPALLDHTAGTLGLRVPDSGEARAVDPRWTLHDFGAHAAGPAVAELDDPRVSLVLVSAATPAGCALATAALTALREGQAGQAEQALARTVLVLAGTFGRHRIGPAAAALAATPGLRGLRTLPADAALAAGGRIPWVRVGRRARQGVDATLDLLLHDPR